MVKAFHHRGHRGTQRRKPEIHAPGHSLSQGLRRLHHRFWRGRRNRGEDPQRRRPRGCHAGGWPAAEPAKGFQGTHLALPASAPRRGGGGQSQRRFWRILGSQWFVGHRRRALHDRSGVTLPLVSLAYRRRADEPLGADRTPLCACRFQVALHRWHGRRLAAYL